LIVGFGAGGTLCARRGSLQTLLVGMAYHEALGLLSDHVLLTQESTR
jgi:hypothetical protein